MIEKSYDIGYLGSGPMGFEEVAGVAGEDLAENDVVGYFNKPNNMYAFANEDTNKYYYNDGNNYYISHDSVIDIYNTDNVLLETRTPVGTLIYTTQSKTLDWSYVLRSSEFCIDIYKYNNSEYKLAVTINILEKYPTYALKATSLLAASETVDYIVVYSQTSYDGSSSSYSRLHYCHIINKEDLSVNEYTYQSVDTKIHQDASIISDYYNNRVCFKYHTSISGSWADNVFINIVNLKTTVTTSIKNPMSTMNYNSSEYLFFRGTDQLIYIYYRPNAGSSIQPVSIYVRNANGTEFIKGYTTDDKRVLYLVSASSDFNEVVYYFNSKMYLINVEAQTVTLVEEDTPNYYIKTNSRYKSAVYDENTIFSIYVLDDSVPDKVGRITGFDASFNKIDHCGQGLFEYVGIVKKDCKQGENAIVYKIVDF